jgi:hypothetical protein
MREINSSVAGSLDAILGDFNPNKGPDRSMITSGGSSVTIWIPQDFKSRYERLQASSKKQFSKKVRLALCALIELAEGRTA